MVGLIFDIDGTLVESSDFDAELYISADHHISREEILKACRTTLSAASGEVVSIGDGPWDYKAAQKLGWAFIGVGPRLNNAVDVWIPHFSCEEWSAAPGRALISRGGEL